jgi:hypothetical protein
MNQSQAPFVFCVQNRLAILDLLLERGYHQSVKQNVKSSLESTRISFSILPLYIRWYEIETHFQGIFLAQDCQHEVQHTIISEADELWQDTYACTSVMYWSYGACM